MNDSDKKEKNFKNIKLKLNYSQEKQLWGNEGFVTCLAPENLDIKGCKKNKSDCSIYHSDNNTYSCR